MDRDGRSNLRSIRFLLMEITCFVYGRPLALPPDPSPTGVGAWGATQTTHRSRGRGRRSAHSAPTLPDLPANASSRRLSPSLASGSRTSTHISQRFTLTTHQHQQKFRWRQKTDARAPARRRACALPAFAGARIPSLALRRAGLKRLSPQPYLSSYFRRPPQGACHRRRHLAALTDVLLPPPHKHQRPSRRADSPSTCQLERASASLCVPCRSPPTAVYDEKVHRAIRAKIRRSPSA